MKYQLTIYIQLNCWPIYNSSESYHKCELKLNSMNHSPFQYANKQFWNYLFGANKRSTPPCVEPKASLPMNGRHCYFVEKVKRPECSRAGSVPFNYLVTYARWKAQLCKFMIYPHQHFPSGSWGLVRFWPTEKRALSSGLSGPFASV